MGIKETIENNIIIVLVTTVVAVVGATFAVVNYFHTQELEEVESRWASIERDLPGIEHYDIRGLISTDDRPIDSELIYFEDDNFYSFKSDQYWKYSKTTELALLDLITGNENEPNPLIESQLTRIPIHLWKGGGSIQMTSEGETFNWFPRITLQKVSYDEIRGLFGVGISFAEWINDDDEDYDFDEEDLALDSSAEEFLAAADKAFYSDAAGVFFLLQNTLTLQSILSSENQVYRIKKIQKIGPILYSQYSTEYSNVEVNGEDATVYIRQELMVISENENLYLINIILPSLEPIVRAKEYANVNNWLTSVKLVIDHK